MSNNMQVQVLNGTDIQNPTLSYRVTNPAVDPTNGNLSARIVGANKIAGGATLPIKQLTHEEPDPLGFSGTFTLPDAAFGEKGGAWKFFVKLAGVEAEAPGLLTVATQ